MSQFNLHYFAWYLTQLTKKLGVLGIFGFAILLYCGFFYVAKMLPLNQQVKSLENQLVQYKRDGLLVNNTGVNQTRERDSQPLNSQDLHATEQDIARFYALFPHGTTLPQWLNTIAQAALKHGLTLNRGDYKLTAQQITKPIINKTNQGQFARYEIVLPVTGQYTQIRKFIADVMEQIPALALSDLQMKRQNSTNPVIEARLVFVLLLQGDSW